MAAYSQTAAIPSRNPQTLNITIAPGESSVGLPSACIARPHPSLRTTPFVTYSTILITRPASKPPKMTRPRLVCAIVASFGCHQCGGRSGMRACSPARLPLWLEKTAQLSTLLSRLPTTREALGRFEKRKTRGSASRVDFTTLAKYVFLPPLMCAQCACECAVHPFSLLTFSSFGALGFLRSRTLPLPLSEGKTHSKNSDEKAAG